MNNDPRGAIWRRWDLHFHTPASFDYKDKSVTNYQIVERLVKEEIRVVAVTDHHTIDVERIQELQELGKDRITILPGIELRSELGGQNSVHYIGIFSAEANLATIWTKLQSLGLTEEDIKNHGNQSIYVEFKKGSKRIAELGGIVTIHAGKKSNSIEQIGNAELFKRSFKSNLLLHNVDALEVGSVSDVKGYRDIVFQEIGKDLPLLICSDNHDIKSYGVKAPMWVRADPNFGGLLQLINEPNGRIFLGDEPPSHTRVSQHGTKYMEKICFERTDHAKQTEKWFEGEVPLNHGLVAIIGNKGSGKSALADVLGLLGNSGARTDFGFLNQKRFLDPKQKLGPMFRAKLMWKDGTIATKTLDEVTDKVVPETVKYIPQNFLEKICSDPANSGFRSELEEVIFSHVSSAQRLGKASLGELIEYQTKNTQTTIARTRLDIGNKNREISSLSKKLAPEFKRGLEAEIAQKKLELDAHLKERPTVVTEPNAETQSQNRSVNADLKKLRESRNLLEKKLQEHRTAETEASRKIALADRLDGAITNFERQFQSFKSEILVDLNSLELEVEDLALLKISRQPILEVRELNLKELKKCRDQLDEALEDSVASEIKKVEQAISDKQMLLDEPNRKYQAYLEAHKAWREREDLIVGSAESQRTLKWFENSLAELSELPNKIKIAEEERLVLCKQIIEANQALLKIYKDLYEPIQKSIDENEVAQIGTSLQVNARLEFDNFQDRFLKFVHQGRTGTFHGDDEGKQRLESMMRETSLDTEEDIIGFLTEVEESLTHDKRDKQNKSVSISSQLKTGFEESDLLNFMYGMEYLQPNFELRWHDKPLDQLSPGERGSLLLIFYLLVDKRDIPLVIDQPEENLDNQTIATVLVPALTHAKGRRQIIIVTHNPNIAVVCDADQIIHSQIDKTDGNRVNYVSGAIENPEITKMVLDVLEGTKLAFDKRDAKYCILDRYKLIGTPVAQ